MLKGVCGIDVDRDRTFISFASLRKFRLNFLQEIEVEIPCEDRNFLAYFRKNCDVFNQKIREKEKEYSLRIEKVFLNLPWDLANISVAEEIIPLKKRKKIDRKDLAFVKKYFEDVFLAWDDFCLHHFILNYEIEGSIYKDPPLGVWAKKIKLKSHLVWIKDELRKNIEDTFDNLDRRFGGLVFTGASIFFTSFTDCGGQETKIVVSAGYEGSRIVVYSQGSIDFGWEYDFGSRKIVQALGKEFSLNPSMAEEIFIRHVSFEEIPYPKEISIKDGESYINLSTHTLNSFVKNYIRNEVSIMLQQIKEKAGKDSFSISFIGRLSKKKGFYKFLKDFIPSNVEVVLPLIRTISSSFGCLNYGMFRFWERDYKEKESVLGRILNIYREYF